MFCDNCGYELTDDATFCPNCGKHLKAKNNKNIYIALILTFFITGLGSIYAGNKIKGLILLIFRIIFSILGLLINIFLVFMVLVWAYAFYEAYRDVEIANGRQNPKLIDDFKAWHQNDKIIASLIICIILIFTVGGCLTFLTGNNYMPSDPTPHYHTSSSSSHGGSSHYGGVDTSPNTIARNDPDSYYDYYEYGDNPYIDDYLESQGYD